MTKTAQPKLNKYQQARQERDAKVQSLLSTLDVEAMDTALSKNGPISPNWPKGWQWIIAIKCAVDQIEEKQPQLDALKRRIDSLEGVVSAFLRYVENGEPWFGEARDETDFKTTTSERHGAVSA